MKNDQTKERRIHNDEKDPRRESEGGRGFKEKRKKANQEKETKILEGVREITESNID
jgi:hypothetical protein